MPAHHEGEGRKWRLMFLVVQVAFVCGCAPMRVNFIQPQAPGGVVRNGHCPPQPDCLLFEREGVVAAVQTRSAESGRRVIYVSFEVPADRRVRLLGSSLVVTTASGERASSPMTGVWYGSGNRSAAVDPDC